MGIGIVYVADPLERTRRVSPNWKLGSQIKTLVGKEVKILWDIFFSFLNDDLFHALLFISAQKSKGH